VIVVFSLIEATGLIELAHERQACHLPLTERRILPPELLVPQGTLLSGAPLSPGEHFCCRRPSLPSLHHVYLHGVALECA
jgi:hypothetical protein